MAAGIHAATAPDTTRSAQSREMLGGLELFMHLIKYDLIPFSKHYYDYYGKRQQQAIKNHSKAAQTSRNAFRKLQRRERPVNSAPTK